jgi:hypothetical protein
MEAVQSFGGSRVAQLALLAHPRWRSNSANVCKFAHKPLGLELGAPTTMNQAQSLLALASTSAALFACAKEEGPANNPMAVGPESEAPTSTPALAPEAAEAESTSSPLRSKVEIPATAADATLAVGAQPRSFSLEPRRENSPLPLCHETLLAHSRAFRGVHGSGGGFKPTSSRARRKTVQRGEVCTSASVGPDLHPLGGTDQRGYSVYGASFR